MEMLTVNEQNETIVTLPIDQPYRDAQAFEEPPEPEHVSGPDIAALSEKYARFFFGKLPGIPDDIIRLHFKEFADEILPAEGRKPDRASGVVARPAGGQAGGRTAREADQ